MFSDSAQALAALKSLGKNPVGSETIAKSANLHAVLSVAEHFKDDVDSSNEALRCIANALLLVESARKTFVRKEVGGGESMVEFLEVSVVLYTMLLVIDAYNEDRKQLPPTAYSLYAGSCSS